MELILIACGLLVMQYVLTFIQVSYYRRSVNSMVRKYKGEKGYQIFAGQSRKKFKSGAIALLVVDENYTIIECRMMNGVSILSKFKEIDEYKNLHVGELLDQIHEASQGGNRKKKKEVSARNTALNIAAEKALLSISFKTVSAV